MYCYLVGQKAKSELCTVDKGITHKLYTVKRIFIIGRLEEACFVFISNVSFFIINNQNNSLFIPNPDL